MAESTRQIEQHIDAERRALGRNLQELEDKAAALTDWRTHYARHPFVMIGAAFGAAMAVGFLSRARSQDEAHRFEAPAADDRSHIKSPMTSNVMVSASRVQEQTVDTWNHIVDALIGVAAARAIDFVSQKIPGFGEEYSRRHPDYARPG
jgi:hypothetical protein